jgi:threonine/homoserine/homoserine lactone efflux protein
MIPFFAGLITGVLVAIPPGPMSVVIIKQTLNHGARRGLTVGAGTTTLDFIYCLAFLAAAGRVFGRVTELLSEYETLVLAFQVVCVLGLVAYGLYSLRSRSADETLHNAKSSELPHLPKPFMRHGPFLLGLGLSLTQMVQPTFVPLMTSISLLAHERGFVHSTTMEYGIFALGYAAGIFTWLYCLIHLSMRYRHLLSGRFLTGLNRFIGLTLIGFGTYLGYRVTTLIRWPELGRLFAF